ncbi:protein FAM151B [Condylostylus longicornis]|uniref:protein FAM151B n=1 Tax=Condylostylus longicornis TaxID=2530218 RepID=UPI00244E41CA|nr:protein FAM151B [Condylostylus longicornis]XP_055375794.1 protein FAM151B [Condylostylus longicornis]XP_055375795.1 protein FAM151B [Condylostylus longicornis]
MVLKCILSGFVILGFFGIIQGASTKSSTAGMEEKPANLTAIKWAHAANDYTLLKKALESKVEMIESDCLMGTLFEDKTKVIPIMSHPPKNESDISLEYYLQNITEYNAKNPNSQKGIKLDFKSIEAFENGIETIKNHSKIIKKMWFNADILNGPGNPQNPPVDALRFLKTAKEISDNNTLSIGWTTDLVTDTSKVKYEESQINQMISLIKDNGIVNRSITYPVRAVYAANSENELKDLLIKTAATNNNGTLSIWSADKDIPSVNIKKLRDLILNIGVHQVYLDVPTGLERELRLNSSGSLKASFINFTIISIVLVFLSEYLK